MTPLSTPGSVNLSGFPPIDGLLVRHLDVARDVGPLAAFIADVNVHDNVDWIPTEASLRRLRDRGLTEAALGADAENLSGAVHLYESLGFSRLRTAANYRKAIMLSATEQPNRRMPGTVTLEWSESD